MESMLEIPSAHVVSFEPAIQVALDADCRIQVRLGLETRTTAYHVRHGGVSRGTIERLLTARRLREF